MLQYLALLAVLYFVANLLNASTRLMIFTLLFVTVYPPPPSFDEFLQYSLSLILAFVIAHATSDFINRLRRI